MSIAITGGTGCIGKPLINELVKNGAYIHLLVSPNHYSINSNKKNILVTEGDLRAYESLKSFVKGSDIVFHLAGKVHSIPKTKKEEQDFYEVNVKGTKNLLTAAKKNNVKRFVYFSTVSVYGKDSNFHGDELSRCNPSTVYAKSKYQAEKLVLDSSKDGGPDGIVLRFPVVYGPGDRGNIAKMIQSIHRKLFFYMGYGENKRSMISSKNAAEAAIRAAFEPKCVNEVFCITDDRDYSIKELAETICEALKMEWRPFHLPISIAKFVGHCGSLIEILSGVNLPLNSNRVAKLSGSLTFSCEKAKNIFKYKPVERLSEGIENEVKWLKSEKGWV